jgi:hypothetical protein
MKFLAPFIVATVLSTAGWADITPGSATDTGNRTTDRPSLTSIIEKANQDAAGSTGTAADADNTRLLKDHLTQEQRAERAAAIKAAAELRLKKATPADAAKAAQSKAQEEEDWLTNASKTVQDVVRPVKENIDELRKTDAEAPLPPVKVPEPLIIVTEEQRKRDRMVNGILWEQFVEDIKPWAIGFGIAGVLLMGVYQWFKVAAKRPSRAALGGSGKRRSSRN